MDELYEILGLDPGEPSAKIVSAVKTMQSKLEDKNEIIVGLQERIKNQEEQIDSIATGVAEARVRDLVNKVQHETGRFVGKDNIGNLQRKAAQYIYASEDEKENIYNDMKAHTTAYGVKVSLDERLRALAPDREEGGSQGDKRYAKAKKLIDSGKAKSWKEAHAMVIEQETETAEE